MTALHLPDSTDGQACQRTIVVNADDFGLAPGVTAGVLDAHRCGIVRSASLMVTTPGFADAVEHARQHPTLDLGLHVALTMVRPVSSPETIPSIVTAAGTFPSPAEVVRRVLTRRIDVAELRRELGAQIDRAVQTQLPFSHIDSHHHVHLLPPIAVVLGDLARAHGIPFVRRVDHPRLPRSGPRAVVKRRLLHHASAMSRSTFHGTRSTSAFVGYPFPRDIDDWRRIATALPAGITELMCHPGYDDPANDGLDELGAEREQERRWLCDPRVGVILEDAGITVSSFAELCR